MRVESLLEARSAPRDETVAAFEHASDSDQAAQFGADMLAALARRPRSISPKWFYDATGSALFDRICELPEYYPTRTELGILAQHAEEIAATIGPSASIIEFGAGSLTKVRLLLDALRTPRRYIPIDISGGHLAHAAAQLRREYPRLRIDPVIADYMRAFELPARLVDKPRRVGFFPGSTLGNLSPEEALGFLRRAAAMLEGGGLLIGVDLVKDPQRLHCAYNDAEGVTAAFNLNLLARANLELGADFDLQAFDHAAFYNAPLQRIEMHLMSRCRQTVTIDGVQFVFEEGETLHTENSRKFTIDGMHAIARRAGFAIGPYWIDRERLFCVQWLSARQSGRAA